MREMKDSGVAWIGQIPEHWEVVRIKNLFDLRNERNDEADLSKVNLISLYTDLGVVQHSDIVETTGNRAVTAEGYKFVHKNDIVVNIILCWMGAVGMSNYDGVTSPAYDIYAPKKGTISEYYHYLFRTKAFNGECYRYGRGIMMMRWRTYSNEFRAISIPFPPADEQREIINYLNERSSQVDRLISNNEAQIEKLKQYKQSLISEVVTKGLDPTVPMKDSGVEWIGEIPEHWGLNRIKYICKFNPSNKCNMDSTLNVSYAPMECVKNGYMLCKEITIDKISSGLTYFEEEDIVMAKVTPCFENGNIAIAENLKNGVGFGSSELFVFRCLQVYNRWLMYFLRSSTFIERAKATMTGTGGLKRVSPNFVNSLTLAIPPKTEQEQISTYLDTKCAQIDSLIAIKQAKIKKLNQYKKSLIYEYVTGKKEVNYNV